MSGLNYIMVDLKYEEYNGFALPPPSLRIFAALIYRRPLILSGLNNDDILPDPRLLFPKLPKVLNRVVLTGALP